MAISPNIVNGGSQIVHAIAEDHRPLNSGDTSRLVKPDTILAALAVGIDGNRVRLRCEKLVGSLYERFEMVVCPIPLGIDSFQTRRLTQR